MVTTDDDNTPVTSNAQHQNVAFDYSVPGLLSDLRCDQTLDYFLVDAGVAELKWPKSDQKFPYCERFGINPIIDC